MQRPHGFGGQCFNDRIGSALVHEGRLYSVHYVAYITTIIGSEDRGLEWIFGLVHAYPMFCPEAVADCARIYDWPGLA